MERREQIAFAKAYPYPRPPHPYVFAGGAALELLSPLPERLEDAAVRARGVVVRLADYCRSQGLRCPEPLEALIPVIAHGSNGAPARLRQKFAAAGGAVIPVLRAYLADFDVVFAPHFARYGAIPATLERSPGTRAEVAVTFLSPVQLKAMDASEIAAVKSDYARGRLSGIRLEVAGMGVLSEAEAYLAKRGTLRFEGAPRALAALHAEGRVFRAHSQEEKLEMARKRLAPDETLDDFIVETIRNERRRERLNAALIAYAAPPAYGNFAPAAGLRRAERLLAHDELAQNPGG